MVARIVCDSRFSILILILGIGCCVLDESDIRAFFNPPLSRMRWHLLNLSDRVCASHLVCPLSNCRVVEDRFRILNFES